MRFFFCVDLAGLPLVTPRAKLIEPRDSEVANTEVASGQVYPSDGRATDLRTFLIADIRGYTAYTREHGDEAAAALASRFAELVEQAVTEHEGFLVELRGDEALVAFVSARRALRAAMELQSRFKQAQLPRGVGIGLDAGEAIPVGAGYRGTALNLAARLCAEAGPGETLASETVIHLAAKVDGIAYVDARALKLKGYGESVRVVDVIPADQVKGRRIASGGRATGLGMRFAVLAGGAVVALVAVAVVANTLGMGPFGPAVPQPSPTTVAQGTAQARGPSVSPTETASSAPTSDPFSSDRLPLLAFYDGSTGELKTTTRIESPRNLAFFSGGSYWMLREDPLAFERIDAATHERLGAVGVHVDEPSGFNFDEKSLWITDLAGPTVVRIDKATGAHQEFSVAADPGDTTPASDIAVGDGSVWLARPEREEITRMDVETGEVTARIPAVAYGVSYGEGALWYWAEGRLGRIDPNSNELTFEPELELGTVGWLNNIYFGGGFAWTTESDSGTLWRVDSEGRSTSFSLEPGIREMASTTDTIWVTNQNTGQLTGVDHVTGRHNRVINTGHATLAVAAGGDELLIAVGPTDDEVIAELQGNVLRISVPYEPWFDPAPDPALNETWEARQGLYLTCLHLVNYPDEPAPTGWTLTPEAAEMPAISDDGLTYTFRIKPGFAFSPPSNEPVTAETFRATIQRLVSPVFSDESPGPAMFADIEGVAEFRSGAADGVSGLMAEGDNLTIRLQAPSPTFLHRLALSMACAVPAGTPALRSGLNPMPPVSGAGPYYVASRLTRRLVILKKNPNYPGPRPQYFDAIAIRMRMAPATAIDHVRSGVSDAAMLPGDEPLAGADSLIALEWGPGSENAQNGDQRWFGAPRPVVEYLALNATRGVFSDPDVRRAVALALDRAELARIFVLTPTDDLYLPGMPGAPFPDEPIAEPNRAAALDLMNGRSFDVTMQGFPQECIECGRFEDALIRQLGEIGINVEERMADDYPADAFEAGSGVDLLLFGIGTDIPDSVELLSGLRENAWLGDDTMSELTRLEGLSGAARSDGAIAFARQLVDEEFLVVPIGYPAFPMFLSERIGCGFVQPAIGAVDLLSLCVEDAVDSG